MERAGRASVGRLGRRGRRPALVLALAPRCAAAGADACAPSRRSASFRRRPRHRTANTSRARRCSRRRRAEARRARCRRRRAPSTSYVSTDAVGPLERELVAERELGERAEMRVAMAGDHGDAVRAGRRAAVHERRCEREVAARRAGEDGQRLVAAGQREARDGMRVGPRPRLRRGVARRLCGATRDSTAVARARLWQAARSPAASNAIAEREQRADRERRQRRCAACAAGVRGRAAGST